MSSKRQRVVRQGVAGSVGTTSTQPAPAGVPLGDLSEIDVIQAELASLEQGMLQLRLQQQEAQAALAEINGAVQQQAGAIAGAKRILQAMEQRAVERRKMTEQVPDPAATRAAEVTALTEPA